MSTNPKDLDPTDSSVDTAAALESISSDLFGQESDEKAGSDSVLGEGESQAASGSDAADPSNPAAGTPPNNSTDGSDANSEAVQAVGAPQTWTKEGLAEWAKIPPRAQEEILKREADMHRGMESYKDKAELGSKYDSVVEPYRAALAAENVDPVGLFQAFAGNHYLLSRGTPEQKTQLGANMVKHYGLDLQAIADLIGNPPRVDPVVQNLQGEVERLRQSLGGVQASTERRQVEELTRQVEAFSADPAHPFFDEVGEDIAQLIASGVATDLQTAYDKAIWANPSTRQKVLASQQQEREAEAKRVADERRVAANRAQAANVNQSQTDRSGTTPLGTMDDTLAETMRDIASRG